MLLTLIYEEVNFMLKIPTIFLRIISIAKLIVILQRIIVTSYLTQHYLTFLHLFIWLSTETVFYQWYFEYITVCINSL